METDVSLEGRLRTPQRELNESRLAIVYSARTHYHPCRHPFSDFGPTHPFSAFNSYSSSLLQHRWSSSRRELWTTRSFPPPPPKNSPPLLSRPLYPLRSVLSSTSFYSSPHSLLTALSSSPRLLLRLTPHLPHSLPLLLSHSSPLPPPPLPPPTPPFHVQPTRPRSLRAATECSG